MVTADSMAVVETAYRLEGSEQEWLASLLRAAEPHLPGRPRYTYAITYDVADPARLEVGTVVTRYFPSDVGRDEILDSYRVLGVADVERSFGRGTCGTASQMFGADAAQVIGLGRHGLPAMCDAFGVNALDPSARGCVLVGLLAAPHRTDSRAAAKWSKIAAHIAAARRLRHVLGGPLRSDPSRDASVEAIFTPAGKMEHSSEEAAAAYDALVSAVRAIERVHTRDRKTPASSALDEWKSMVDARWSLIHHFDSDGKRYVVAVRNEAPLAPPLAKHLETLTLRERQVVGFTLLGHSNKVAAYELGLAAPTLRVLLARARKKLGIASTTKLMRLSR